MDQSSTTSISDDLVLRLQEAESQLNHLRRELEHSHRLVTVGILAASVAHEVNNLLTPVLSYAQLAKAKPEDRDLQAKAHERAIASSEAASRILQSMMSFAAPCQQAQEADVAEVIKEALVCLARDPSRDGIKVSLHIQPGAAVKMHPLSLQQVMLNLILNACRVMRPTGGELKITAITRTDGTGLITVSDTGPGVPPDIAGRLFEPFVTSNPAKPLKQNSHEKVGEKELGGSGLGLAICRQLVESAGGTISLSSESSRGATFTVIVPSAPRTRALAG